MIHPSFRANSEDSSWRKGVNYLQSHKPYFSFVNSRSLFLHCQKAKFNLFHKSSSFAWSQTQVHSVAERSWEQAWWWFACVSTSRVVYNIKSGWWLPSLSETLHNHHYLKLRIDAIHKLPFCDKSVELAVRIGSTLHLAAFCILLQLWLQFISCEVQAFFGLLYPACWKHGKDRHLMRGLWFFMLPWQRQTIKAGLLKQMHSLDLVLTASL